MLPNIQCKLPLAQLWAIPAHSITSYPCTPGRNHEGGDSHWSHWGKNALGVDGRFSTGHVQGNPVSSDAWEGTNVSTTISLKCSSGSRPKINEGIFTELSIGLLAHAVFEIITPFWKTVHNRKVHFFWNSSNSAETVWIDGTKTKSYLSFMKSSLQLTLHDSLWESVKMAVHVQKWLSTYSPAGSCTRIQKPVSSQVPFNISKKWSNIYLIDLKEKQRAGVWQVHHQVSHINYKVVFSLFLHFFHVQCLTCNKRLTRSVRTHFIHKKQNLFFSFFIWSLQERQNK